MALRIQKERFNKETKVDLENYKSKWRIDKELLDQCKKNICRCIYTRIYFWRGKIPRG
jgi:aspartate carbamoyltransferase catalytic subunit